MDNVVVVPVDVWAMQYKWISWRDYLSLAMTCSWLLKILEKHTWQGELKVMFPTYEGHPGHLEHGE